MPFHFTIHVALLKFFYMRIVCLFACNLEKFLLLLQPSERGLFRNNLAFYNKAILLLFQHCTVLHSQF